MRGGATWFLAASRELHSDDPGLEIPRPGRDRRVARFVYAGVVPGSCFSGARVSRAIGSRSHFPSRPPRSSYPMRFSELKSGVHMPIKLTINNVATTVDVPPDTPLLWVLRDVLQYTGTKFGCGMGVCGACTVMINGRAVRSCITRVGSLTEDAITTIEGLSPDGQHPVQVAWEALDVPQCGYCQAGQIMSAAALLAHTPHPTDEEIDTAMSGNICRCGTYPRIRQAIHEAAEAGAAAGKQ